MRAFIALSGMKPVGEKLYGLGDIGLGDPIGSIGVLLDYVGDRIQREVRPDKVTKAHPELEKHADAISDQVEPAALGDRGPPARAPRRDHGAPVPPEAALGRRRPTSSARSRRSRGSRQIFEDQGVEPSGQERYIADTFCTRAAARVRLEPRPGRVERRRADDRDRQARLQARRVRLRAVRGLSTGRLDQRASRADRRGTMNSRM